MFAVSVEDLGPERGSGVAFQKWQWRVGCDGVIMSPDPSPNPLPGGPERGPGPLGSDALVRTGAA